MTDTPTRPELPDHLSIDPRSPHHVAAIFEHDVGPTHLRVVLRGQPEQRLTPEWVEKRRQAQARAEAGCEACRRLELDDAKMDSALERARRLRVRVPSDSESAAIEAPPAPRGSRAILPICSPRWRGGWKSAATMRKPPVAS